MFHLVIDHQGVVDVTAHPSREMALSELLKILDRIDCDYRVIQASWDHSSYELLDRALLADPHGPRPLATGQAAIEQICGCQHSTADHDEAGCTVEMLVAGRVVECECRAYRPVAGEPTLFDIHSGEHRDSNSSIRAAS